jgi:ribosomal subunit interface protein
MNNILYKASGIELTDSIKEYVEKKLSIFFKKYTIVDDQIEIEVGKTTNHHKNGEIFFAEANFKTSDKNIFARSEREDLYEAIDELQKEVGRQLDSVKGKKLELFKRGARKIKKILKLDF